MNWDFVRRNIQRLKDNKALSDNEIARRSGVPQPTISRFLTAENDFMQLDTLVEVARALGASVAELIGEQPIELDERTRRVIKAMEQMPEYKKDVVVSTAETLAKPG